MEDNRDAYTSLLNKQIKTILNSSQIASLREQILKMNTEIEMYENLLADFVQSFDPEKIAE